MDVIAKEPWEIGVNSSYDQVMHSCDLLFAIFIYSFVHLSIKKKEEIHPINF